MRTEVINFGQRNRQMHGDPVYRGDPAAEKYPDAQNSPPYLANANHYWSFFGFNTFDGYFRITDLRYWKPTSLPSGTERLQSPGTGRWQFPGAGGNRKIEAPAGSVTKRDPDPIPANVLRIYIRYHRSHGHGTFGLYAHDQERNPGAGDKSR